MGIKVSFKDRLLEFDHPPSSEEILQEYQRQCGSSQRSHHGRADVRIAGIVPAPPAIDYPLSSGQESFWFLSQLEPNNPFLVIPFALNLRGPLVRESLERALTAVIQRHSSLRVGFESRGGVPKQVIHSDVVSPLRVVDASTLSDGIKDEENLRIARSQAEEPFDLSCPPLFRVALVRKSACEHALLVTMHHIISDADSVRIFCQDLASAYEAIRIGGVADFEPLPVQYHDYAVWQNQKGADGRFRTAELYWKSQLQGDIPALDLPTDLPRPSRMTYAGAAEQLVIDSRLKERIESLSRQSGVTVFMTLLAAFSLLMARYSGKKDIVIGVPVSNRRREETRSIIGYFANVVPIRVQMWGNPSFAELLARVRIATLNGYRHQDCPLASIVRAVNPQRVVGNSPLFQVLMGFPTNPFQSFKVGDLLLTALDMPDPSSEFDLIVEVLGWDSMLTVKWQYCTDLWRAGTIKDMIKHYERLLRVVGDQPDVRIFSFETLDSAERQRFFGEGKRGSTGSLTESFPAVYVPANSLGRGAAQAVICGEKGVSYGELDSIACNLAQALSRRDVRARDKVAIYLPRSVESVAAMLASFKLGAAFVPLDMSFPPSRIAQMIIDSGAKVVVAREDSGHIAAGTDVPVVTPDSDPQHDLADTVHLPLPPVLPDDIAYIIYTSGSTGIPKGVALTFRNLAHYQRSISSALEIVPEDVCAQASSIAFAASIREIFVPLFKGATLVIATEIEARDPRALVERAVECKTTVLGLIPTMWRQILELLESDPDLRRRLADSALRFCVSNSEALAWGVVQKLRASLSKRVKFINLYGNTETGIVSAYPIQDDDQLEEGIVPIGKAVAGTAGYLVDGDLNLVPAGVRGEICVSSDGVAQGYVGTPELTAAKFIPDPFSPGPGRRLYRTGDLARYRRDGILEHLGRVDRQVKVRGMRLDINGIEAMVENHPAIRQCVIAHRGEEGGGNVLTAYFVPDMRYLRDRGLREFPLDELLQQMRARLPSNMVPSSFVQVTGFPRTRTGKIARDELPSGPQTTGMPSELFEPPSTAIETSLAGIWSELLGVAGVGRGDNFFDLGGHSLMVMRLVSRIRGELGATLTVREVFEAPTVAELSVLVESRTPAEGTPS